MLPPWTSLAAMGSRKASQVEREALGLCEATSQ